MDDLKPEKMEMWEYQVGYVSELRLIFSALKAHDNLQAFFVEENEKLKVELGKFDGSPYYQGKNAAYFHFHKNIVERIGWDGWQPQTDQEQIVRKMVLETGKIIALCYRHDGINVRNPFLDLDIKLV